LTDCL